MLGTFVAVHMLTHGHHLAGVLSTNLADWQSRLKAFVGTVEFSIAGIVLTTNATSANSATRQAFLITVLRTVGLTIGFHVISTYLSTANPTGQSGSGETEDRQEEDSGQTANPSRIFSGFQHVSPWHLSFYYTP
jgi:hypothetical protein